MFFNNKKISSKACMYLTFAILLVVISSKRSTQFSISKNASSTSAEIESTKKLPEESYKNILDALLTLIQTKPNKNNASKDTFG